MEKRILGNPADPLRSAAQLEPGMWVRLLYPDTFTLNTAEHHCSTMQR
jgi:hypothetical protein